MENRRDFLKSLAALTSGVALSSNAHGAAGAKASDRLGDLLPTRTLGRTGEQIPMLGVGGWHIGRMSESEAQRTIETALEGGVRFFDTASHYQSGGSERRLGKLLVPEYRDAIFLMTKAHLKDADSVRQQLDTSLRRLNTDYLDLWQMHEVMSLDDLNNRIDNGVLDVFHEAKESGKARYIGFTGHKTPATHERILELTDMFDTCQMPVNAADPSYGSFINNVMPKLVDHNLGILAMKTLGCGGFFGGTTFGQHGNRPKVVPDRISMREAIHFVWSLPVTTLISGPDDAAQIQEKIDLARSFDGMSEQERYALIEKVADLAGDETEFYKASGLPVSDWKRY